MSQILGGAKCFPTSSSNCEQPDEEDGANESAGGKVLLSSGLSVSECTDLNQMSRGFNERW